jgi:tRNA-dihydrouridine synthase 1
MEWWRSLGSPRLIAAPMVDQSELAFRQLCREHGCQLAVTPMLHARMCLEQPDYLKTHFSTTRASAAPPGHADAAADAAATAAASAAATAAGFVADRPLLAQFCGNDAATLVAAARLVEHAVDGVDLNLGCPQGIARRGRYGAFLLEETALLVGIVSALHAALRVPVTCKIRVLPTLAATVALCRALEAAGCSLLTVHGRTRHNMKQAISAADWEAVRTIKRAVSIPVVCNGSLACFDDVRACLDFTGCDGVMTSEALLENPGLFSDNVPTCGPLALALCGGGAGDSASASASAAARPPQRSNQFVLARRYLELAVEHSAGWTAVKPHVFKLLFGAWRVFPDLRARLSARVADIADIRAIVDEAEARYAAGEADFDAVVAASAAGGAAAGGAAGGAAESAASSPLESAAADLLAMRAQLAAARAARPNCAWSEPEYLRDVGHAGAWYMRHRPDAYNGRKAPSRSDASSVRSASGSGEADDDGEGGGGHGGGGGGEGEGGQGGGKRRKSAGGGAAPPAVVAVAVTADEEAPR